MNLLRHSTYLGGLAFLLLLYVAGCSSTPKPTEGPANQEISSTDEQIFVGDSVEMSYDPNVIMKRAESFFEKESYAEAIVEYKHFMELHRNHILAPYAQYKIGVSHFKQYQTVDRDPEPLKQSLLAFDKLLIEFPASRYEAEAQETIVTCKEQLAERHLMVGEFYLKRGSYLAAAHRFEKIIKDFPEVDLAGDAMFHLAKTYQDLGIEEWTQDWLVALVNQHPDNQYQEKAQQLLTSLQESSPTLLASLPEGQTPIAPTPNISSSPEISLDGQGLPSFSNAGILPIGSNPINLNTVTPTQTVSSPKICAIGTWCDSQSVPASTIPSQISPRAKSCKTGEWC